MSKKRFIAGAVCPSCGEMDKLVLYMESDKNVRECVACGFKDVMHIQQQPRELETRVNKTEEEKQAEVQVLNFPPQE
ncbi:YheV family putative zinc ribbon protein [Teredinibacter sp. KSP-S5-2]|uniref:YheV family putative zinc ribbon protein n=1 Tax=Teredinibacter sp. KSP-S5-2 TaxID=3034506 RepID=UPI002934368D|nr:YheV family putative zinc ribbon protein [Teredinibacter sp. KSP-S5-2]WNO09177.1 YheV family putative zinc ribbon protein [Teredinibacter sp. KSP-S5-2]